MKIPNLSTFALTCCLSAVLAWATPAAAREGTLKVCSAQHDLPYSDENGSGFENRLAQILADALNRKLEHVYWEDPRYFIRDYLEKRRCDVVVGVDSEDPRLATSKAYYRSGYVFVHPRSVAIPSWESPVIASARRIAFVPDTPADVMLHKLGRYNDMFNYVHSLVGFKSRRNAYVRWDPERLVAEVADGKADLAVLWGPTAARYVKRHPDLTMTVIPDTNVRSDGQAVPHHYSTSVGVRPTDRELTKLIDAALLTRKDAIAAVLADEGIPLVEPNQGRQAAR